MDLSIAVTLALSVSWPHSVFLSVVMVTGDGAYTLMFMESVLVQVPSVTVSFTRYAPVLSYLWLTALVFVVYIFSFPSPQFHFQLVMVPNEFSSKPISVRFVQSMLFMEKRGKGFTALI